MLFRAVIIVLYFFLSTTRFGLVGGTDGLDESNQAVVHRGNVLLSGSANNEYKDKAKFIYYLSGYDYEDRPVIVMEWGKWDLRSVAEEGGEELKRYESSSDAFLELVLSGFFNKKTTNNETEIIQDEYAAIIDFDGLNLRQVASIAGMKLFVKSMAKLERTFTRFAYGFIVNANPLVHQLIHLSKPYMGKYLERMEVYGTNSQSWAHRIIKKIPRSQLHPAYGGTPDFRPLAVYSLL